MSSCTHTESTTYRSRFTFVPHKDSHRRRGQVSISHVIYLASMWLVMFVVFFLFLKQASLLPFIHHLHKPKMTDTPVQVEDIVAPVETAPAVETPAETPAVEAKADNSAQKAQILKQVEFYFSDSNLPSDKFMSELVSKSKEGCTLKNRLFVSVLFLLSDSSAPIQCLILMSWVVLFGFRQHRCLYRQDLLLQENARVH